MNQPTARKVFVARTADFPDGSLKIVSIDGTEIGVYHHRGNYYAYRNLCAHQGGPACEGLLMPQVQEVLGPDRSFQRMGFNYDEWHIVCPWHGWEYDLQSGEMVGDRKFRLKKYEVAESEGEIHVLV
jgi:nitrite reductase (NADH) small subunit